MDARPNSNDRGYTYAWSKRRAAFLKKYPTCRDCGGRATEAHHEPDRKVLLAAGVKDPDATKYLIPLCKSCHSRRTARDHAREPRTRRKATHPGLTG